MTYDEFVQQASKEIEAVYEQYAEQINALWWAPQPVPDKCPKCNIQPSKARNLEDPRYCDECYREELLSRLGARAGKK